ncbi:hypothetical protein [Nannocystis pusilla]|uniref:hypothetical protein n=1 Tax=Nannocystis pusilla TaxID=889268 RepID=UPI003B80810D
MRDIAVPPTFSETPRGRRAARPTRLSPRPPERDSHDPTRNPSGGASRRAISLFFVASAHAAPVPSNDDIADAIVITEPSFSDKLNTGAATTAPDDPVCFGNSATVWYEYTSAVDERIHVDTFGSNYDTTLSVYTDGSSEPLVQLACEDDTIGLESAIDFEATAGVTYFFMVAAFGSENSGGATRFNFEVDAPLEISVQFDPGVLGELGDAFLDFTVVCSRPATVDISGLLTQKSKGLTRSASSSSAPSLATTRPSQPWARSSPTPAPSCPATPWSTSPRPPPPWTTARPPTSPTRRRSSWRFERSRSDVAHERGATARTCPHGQPSIVRGTATVHASWVPARAPRGR